MSAPQISMTPRDVGGTAVPADPPELSDVHQPGGYPERPPRAISCGCCTGGCICHFHQDTPRGKPPAVCDYHRAHGHPRETEAPQGWHTKGGA